jgi:hypothetical protein
MQSKAKTTEEYLKELPEDRKIPMKELIETMRKNLPKGFQETMSYGMITYCVPHSTYPNGYHCNPEQPLPFLSIASQKNFIAFYHMGIYGDPKLLNWFQENYVKESKAKLDMGKSCVRFKKFDQIPLRLLGELASKMTPKQWIEQYESVLMKRK